MSVQSTASQTDYFIDLENQYSAHNYHPLPVVLKKEKAFLFGMWKAKNIMTF